MSADVLREAANLIRNGWDDSGPKERGFHLAVADWLDTAGADLWAHGPLHCDNGCMECDDDLWAPHARRALAVARAYLGTSDA